MERFGDRIQETTATSGTGPLALAGALAGFVRFSALMSVGDTCGYVIVDPTTSAWETGTGTYSATNQLTRAPAASSNGGAALVLAGNASTLVSLSLTASVIARAIAGPGPSTPVTVTSGATSGAPYQIPSTPGTLVRVAQTTPATSFLAAPLSPVLGQRFTVHDVLANSATYNISIAPGSGMTIGGGAAGAAYVFAENGLQVEFIYAATNTWEVFGILYSTTIVNNLLDQIERGGFVGVPGASQRAMISPLPHVITLPAGLAGSLAVALTAATAQTVITLAYLRGGNTTSIATITFAAGGTTGTFNSIAIPTLQVGDVLLLTAPSSPDATLADIGVAILGSKT